MSNDVFVITEHLNGKIADISYEMVGKAKALASALGGQAVAVVLGSGMDAQAATFSSDKTIYIDNPALTQFNPEAQGKVVESLVAAHSPRLTLFGSSSMGMDVAAWLSAKKAYPCAAYVKGLAVEGNEVVAICQVYAGKAIVEAVPSGEQAIALILAGSFSADDGRGSTPAEHTVSPVPLDSLRTRFVKLIQPEGGDVDITAQDKLVSIGRGIGSKDDIEIAEELAEALGAAVAASRPVTDAGWLPKTRQVGKSGVSVKPKLYLALGISGAPEHIEGMKDAELIIAVNIDPNAPIFDYAHYGTTCDLFDVAEEMLESL
jgi:electron transfer flavoprotein alpha subunit